MRWVVGVQEGSTAARGEAHRERALQLLLDRVGTVGASLTPLHLLSLLCCRETLLRGGQLCLLVIEVDYQRAVLLLQLTQLRLSLHL